jgi:hypothetical protein
VNRNVWRGITFLYHTLQWDFWGLVPPAVCYEPYTGNVYCSIQMFISKMGTNFTASRFMARNKFKDVLPDSVTIFFIYRYLPIQLQYFSVGRVFIVTIFCTFSNLQILCFPYSVQLTDYTTFNPTKTQSQTILTLQCPSYMFWPLHGHLQRGLQQRNTIMAHSIIYVQSKIQCFQLNC